MKTNKNLFIGMIVLILSSALLFTSCQKQDTGASNMNGTRQFSLYLTDDPCQYDSLFIDIRYVEVKIDTSRHRDDDDYGDNDDDGDDDGDHHDEYGKWDTLTIRPGVYNILALRNGIDTLLAQGTIPAGAIRKIRLTLGTNNVLVVGGVRKPLNLFPGSNNYVYVKIHDEDDDDTPAQSSLWLDFNVCESIKLVGGQYYLKPMIKPFGMNNFGKIEGKVLPNAARAVVKARNATDSATAIPEDDGEFKIRGLKPGTYSLLFTAANGYKDSTVLNVQVQKGRETKIATVILHR